MMLQQRVGNLNHVGHGGLWHAHRQQSLTFVGGVNLKVSAAL